MLAVGQKKTLSPLVVHNNLQIDLNEPDLFLDSDSLSQLPKDLLTIPFLHDVLSEDFVFYYQNHADRLGIEGSIRRIVYEHDLTLKDKLFSSLLDQPAQAALWHDKQGHLSHYMVLIQRSGLSKLLEPLLFAATSDSQLSKTEISSIKINSETVPVYQLRYNGNNALMFATYQDKMLVFSSTDMLFKDDQQDTEATAIAGDLLSGKKTLASKLWPGRAYCRKNASTPAHRSQRQVAGVWLPAVNAFFCWRTLRNG